MDTSFIDAILYDPKKIKVVQIAPAVRVSIGEPFGCEPGTVLTPQLICALRRIGFDYIFDTNFGADVVVMEENEELEARAIRGTGPLPLLNSCCPGFAMYLERNFLDLYVNNMATTKSPMEVMGTLIKTYFAQKQNIDPKDIYSVALMPCMMKKLEAKKDEHAILENMMAVDAVITTSEMAEFFKQKKIDLPNCEKGEFDKLMGESSSSARIFGTTGGVSEATLRYHAKLHNKTISEPTIRTLRGFENTRELVFEIAGKPIKILVVHGVTNAEPILKDPKLYKQYHFIEVMACTGGCIGGSGQPKTTPEIVKKRREGLYSLMDPKVREQSAQNQSVQTLYLQFLGEVGSQKAHELLHVYRTKEKTQKEN